MKDVFLYLLMILFTSPLQNNSLQARQPYRAILTLGSEQAVVNDPNLIDLTRDLRSTAIEQILPFYTPTSPLGLGINLRGIPILGGFAANSTTLTIAIPQANIVESFTGSTRDESLVLFRDFVRNGGTNHRLLKAYARFSPIDPIAGNPNSLMSQMVMMDYSLGRLSPLSGCDCCWSSQPVVRQYQAGSYYIRGFSHGFDTTGILIPLRYTYSPNLDWAFIIDAPLNIQINGGATSIFSSLGLGFRFPVTPLWSLTPIARLGFGGSFDLCTGGNFVDVGVTSNIDYPYRHFVLSMTNYAGYMTTTNLWLTGINFNYNLHQFGLRNGLSVTSCEGLTLCGRPLNFHLALVDTYFAKDQLYINHFDEVEVSVITGGLNPCFDEDSLSLGFAYLFGQKNFSGYRVHLTYQF